MALASASFSLVDGNLFKALPIHDPERVYVVFGGAAGQELAISLPDLQDWSAAVPGARFAAFQRRAPLSIGPVGKVQAAAVDTAFFEVLGTGPLVGGFGPGHVAEGERLALVISHSLWERKFGSRRDIVGTILPAEGSSPGGSVIVGVLPSDFVFPDDRHQPDILVPLSVAVAIRENRRARAFGAIVRRPSEMSLTEFQALLDRAATGSAADYGKRATDTSAGFDRVILRAVGAYLTARQRQWFLLLFIAAVVLLFLAAINLAGLFVVRFVDRRQEWALQVALGASRRHLSRLVAAEVGLLLAFAAILGLAFAGPLTRSVLAVLPDGVLLLKQPRLDARLLLFAVSAWVVATTFVVLAQMGAVNDRGLSGIVRGRSIGTNWRTIGRRVLIAAQVGLAFVLMLGGSLLIGSLARVWQEEPGFQVERTAILEVGLGMGPAAAVSERIRQLLGEVRRHQGVEFAAAFQGLFLERALTGSPFRLPPGATPRGLTEVIPVSSQFFELTGITPTEGRLLSNEELDGKGDFILVSERTAAAYWPGRAAVGQRLNARLGSFQVVGVVPDVRYAALDLASQGEIYMSLYRADQSRGVRLLTRTADDGSATLMGITKIVTSLGPPFVLEKAGWMKDSLATSIRMRRFHAWLLGSFGAAALLIVSIGIFGVVSMTTRQRTKEIGLRVALGSSAGGVLLLVVREQLMPISIGLVCGAVVSYWLVRPLRSYLYQLTVYDLGSWAIAGGAVLVAAVVAVGFPAMRAAAVDPARALRQE